MNNHPVLIVGGGLAGLTAARLLHREGIDFQLLEARERLGGRILSLDAGETESADGFDLGASWFWPAMQPALAALVAELGLACFPQNSDGDVVIATNAPNAGRANFSTAKTSPSSASPATAAMPK